MKSFGGPGLKNDRGANLMTHGILTGLIAVVAIGAVSELGKKADKGACKVIERFEEEGRELPKGLQKKKADCDAQKNEGGEADSTLEPTPDPVPEPVPEPAQITQTTGPSCGEYASGDEMIFTVTYDREVYANMAYIEIDVGGVVRHAALKSGSGTNVLTFSYVMADDDEDTDGVEYVDHIVHGEVVDSEGVAADADFTQEAADTSCATAAPKPVAACTKDCMYIGMANGDLIKLGDDGEPVWTVKADIYEVMDVVVDSQGFIYTGGNAVRKWDSDGNMIWSSYGGRVYEMAITPSNNVVAVNKQGYVYNYRSDGSAVSSGYQPRVSNRYGDYPTGLEVDNAGRIFVTTHYGEFARINPSTMLVEWEYHPTNDTSTAHIGGLTMTSDGWLYTTEWAPTTKTSFGEHRDAAKDEVVAGWRINPSTNNPEFLEGMVGEAKMGAILAGPSGKFAAMTTFKDGYTGDDWFGFRSGSLDPVWEGYAYGDIHDMVAAEGDQFWVVSDRPDSGVSYITPLRFSDGKQKDASGTYVPSHTLPVGARSVAIDLLDKGVDQ
jgi:hypothetical protein